MIEPGQLIWAAFIAFLFLLLLALLEIHRSNYRRENEVMFGTDVFDEKVKAFGFTPKEVRTLEKLVRASKFENKDAVLNSACLFESAVGDFYDFRNVLLVRDETLDAIAGLREKLGFMASNPSSKIQSSRQFAVGDRVDVILDNGIRLKHSEILWKNEKEWAVLYDGSCGPVSNFVGKRIRLRWTRPEDAVYSIYPLVRSARPGEFVIEHRDDFEKQQLRRWVREVVNFPVEATLGDGTTCDGMLYDLSAGGILVGLPLDGASGEHVRIKFDLPGFGVQDVEIEFLRNLGHRNPNYPEYYSITASFTGTYGWTQEMVLQYVFEAHKAKMGAKNTQKMV
ncbi:MAG: PilZ domain-containing protein [Fibrobacter sp.]|nr:PilZ domain-containing protein [Fibrobacter sp.]